MSGPSPKVRINMRIPADLFAFIKEDAKQRRSTMTQDFVDYLTALKATAETAGKQREGESGK